MVALGGLVKTAGRGVLWCGEATLGRAKGGVFRVFFFS